MANRKRGTSAKRLSPCALGLVWVVVAMRVSTAQTASADAKQVERALTLQQKGSLQEAQKIFASVIPRLQVAHDEVNLGRALSASSNILLSLGNYQVAVGNAEEARRIHRKLGDELGEARDLNAIGLGRLYLGEYDRAIENYEVALRIDRAHNYAEGEITRLNNIGNAHYYQGKYLDAYREYQAALEKVKTASRESWSPRRRQLTIANLATLFERLGQHERALELYLELRSSPQALIASEQARLLANLGTLYRRLGDPRKALETYRAAQELFAREQHRDGQIGVLKNIGIVLALDLHNLPAALGSFERAMYLAKSSSNVQFAQSQLYEAETLRRMGLLERARREFEAALNDSIRKGSTEDEWRALYGLGRIADESGDRDLALKHYRQAIARIERVRARLELPALKREFLADKRDVYDAAVELLTNRPDHSLQELFDLMEQSRARLLQDNFSRPTLKSIQSRLDDRTALLEFWTGKGGAAVLYITRLSEGVLRQKLVNVQALCREASSGTGTRWRTMAAELGDALLGGVKPLADVQLRNILIVPDGALNALPFELLAVPKEFGGSRPLLIERATVFYMPTAALLLRDSRGKRNSWQVPWHHELLAFADPIGAGAAKTDSGSALPGDERLERLPKAAEEVQSISGLISGRSELHIGSDALKRYLTERPVGAPLIHLSTHATADAVDPERSRIVFAPRQPTEQFDGLFLREIYGLDLNGVDLVTLSACDTETGKLVPGEGVQGFGRAFLAAGSRATVASLWRVADQPTAEFMKQFYYGLVEGKSKAEALRQAKLKFLRSGSALAHPRYWAAFVLNGDGLTPIPLFLSWRLLLLGTTFFIVVATLLGTGWRRGRKASPRRHREGN